MNKTITFATFKMHGCILYINPAHHSLYMAILYLDYSLFVCMVEWIWLQNNILVATNSYVFPFLHLVFVCGSTCMHTCN